MNVGLPGAGIGGLYYLICTAVMPAKELYLTLTKPGHQYRYRLVITQLGIASAIVLGFIGIYQLLNTVFGADLSLQVQISSGNTMFGLLLPIVISLALLIFILALVEVFAFIEQKRTAGAVKK